MCGESPQLCLSISFRCCRFELICKILYNRNPEIQLTRTAISHVCSTVASHSPGKLRNPGNSQQFPNPKSLEKTKKTKKTKFWEPNGEGYGLMPHWASKIWFFWFFWFSRGFWVFANLRIPPGALKSIQGINLFSHLLECLFFLVKVYLHHRGQFEPCYCCYAF